MEYVHWLAQVNATLGQLSNHIFTAEDFDYPWIEAHLKDTPPDQAAKDALAGDGFIVENLPAPAMLLKDTIFPRDLARHQYVWVTPQRPAMEIHVFGNRDPRGSDNEIEIWLDRHDRLHIRVYKANRCYAFSEVIETAGMVEVVQK